MRIWMIIFFLGLLVGQTIYGQPSSVNLEIENLAAQNIRWFVANDDTNYSFVRLSDFDESLSIVASSAGVFYATYVIDNCQHSTIPSIVRCIKGCDVTKNVTLVPSPGQITPSSVLWTLDGIAISTENNLTTSDLGTFAAIKSYSTACPPDTQMVSVFGLYCSDGGCGNFPWRGGD